MKAFSYVIMLFAISFCVLTVSQAAGTFGMTEQTQRENSPVTMVSGLVEDVQGDWCIVQDSQGTKWKIQVDNYTETIGLVLPGVMISAMVEADGHAKEVKVLPNS